MHVDASKVEAAAGGDQGQAARQGHVIRVASRRRGAQLELAPLAGAGPRTPRA